MTARQGRLDTGEPPPLFTVGYERHTPDSLVTTLLDAGVEHLVDVRERPLSRKPGFSKRALQEKLEASGIRYSNPRELGVPAAIRNPYKQGGAYEDFVRAYRRHLDGHRDAVADLADLAHRESVALLCLEADVDRCHRSLLATRLGRRGLRVVHL